MVAIGVPIGNGCDDCETCCLLQWLPYWVQQESDGQVVFYKCYKLYWNCKCPGGTLKLQRDAGASGWVDIAGWTPDGPNYWYGNSVPGGLGGSSGYNIYRLKCTIDVGLSTEMTYYSLQVGPPPTPQPDCTCTAAGVRKRRVIEIDYLNSSNNPATLILEEGESSGPVQTYGQRVTIFGSDGNCPTGSHLLEVSIPTGGTVTKCKIPTCAATGEFWSGSFEIWQCTPTVQRNYTFTAMRLSLIDCEDVPACGGAYIYSRTFPNELMPRGKVGVPYSFTFEHGGINGAGITAGLSTPPPGLSVSSAGVISGTPTTAGTYNRQVTGVSTIGSCTIVEPYTIIIDP
jgi:hypothetical protein